MPAEAKLRVARKTQMLIRNEGKKPDQAFATAMSMEKAGRLGEKSGYKRVKKTDPSEGAGEADENMGDAD
jgi:hypothetical protein